MIGDGSSGGGSSPKTDFSLFRRLAPLHQPRERLTATVLELKAMLDDYLVAGKAEASGLTRLRVLTDLVGRGTLDEELRWPEKRMPGRATSAAGFALAEAS
jgi:hypothetical protein